MDFADKSVLITGSSRGIGYAAAMEFLSLGARVAINGHSDQSTRAAMEKLDSGNRLVAAPGDIGTVAGCEAAVGAAIAGLGGLDVLVNNAGVSYDAPIEDSDEAIWDRTLDINLKGTYFCSRAALSALRKSGGSIVNVASSGGLIGYAALTVYCASKGGVVNLTRAMAMELAPEVRVNCVCPGDVDTDMVRRDGFDRSDDPAAAERAAIEHAPMKKIATPREVGRAITYLASTDAGFITGAALAMDGGSTAGR